MAYPYTLPDLEERFLPPENWQVGDFTNPDTNHKIHYSFALIQNPKGSVLCLPGLSEFGEKYIETARFFNTQGYNFFVLDWAYQGHSCRLREEPQKRHSDGYDTDISDLDYFIHHIIKTNTKLYMLGHSMGGHIALRYLATQEHKIQAASVIAPMLGIKSIRYFPTSFRFLLTSMHMRYVPGGKDWHELARKSDGTDIFSSDPIRDKIHNAWSLSNPELQLGNPTYKWLSESIVSIALLRKKSVLQKIKIPVLMTYATGEVLVENSAIIKACRKIKSAKPLKLTGAKHEVLMEKDEFRDVLLEKTLEIFKQST